MLPYYRPKVGIHLASRLHSDVAAEAIKFWLVVVTNFKRQFVAAMLTQEGLGQPTSCQSDVLVKDPKFHCVTIVAESLSFANPNMTKTDVSFSHRLLS